MCIVSVVQMKPKIGDVEHNSALISDLYKATKSDIIIFPELAITGYYPKDILLSQNFLSKVHQSIENIAKYTNEKVLIIGAPVFADGRLYNAAIVMQSGRIIATSYKGHLPNYGVFNESRYFAPETSTIFEAFGTVFGVAICEDMWHSDVIMALRDAGAQVILSPNASPFDVSKVEKRMDVARRRFEESGLPIVYANQVANHDGILYDGASFFYDGKKFIFAKQFEEDVICASFSGGIFTSSASRHSVENDVVNALVFGLKEYVYSSGFQSVIIGLSGGADSALVAKLACDAFGSKNVYCYGLKTKFTSDESIEDAFALAKNLNVYFEIFDIENICQQYIDMLDISGLAAENIQARVRGNILMAFSNKKNAMVLTTGNKSEVAVGYCTLYGDMCGGYNPIKDLYKTEVWNVMRQMNARDAVFPERIISKEPSAELRENQKDSDSLPPYHILDAILHQIIENGKVAEEIDICDVDIVRKVERLVKMAEYKRHQSAIGTKLSTCSFEKSEWQRNII